MAGGALGSLAFAEICGESLDLGAGFFECAGAIDGIGRAPELFFHGKLRGDASAGFGFAHAAGTQAFKLLFRRAPGDDETVEFCGHAGFDKQRSFDEGGGVSAFFLPVFELAENDLVNARMKNGVEPRELCGIGENDGSKFVAVDAAGRVGEIGAERLQNFVVSDLPGFHQFVGDGIGVQNRKAEFTENHGDSTFAAGDAAGEAELQHGRRCAPSGRAAGRGRLALQVQESQKKIVTGARPPRWWRGGDERLSPCCS